MRSLNFILAISGIAVSCTFSALAQSAPQNTPSTTPSTTTPSTAPQTTPQTTPSPTTGSQNVSQPGTNPQANPANNSSAKLNDSDKRFLQEAGEGGLVEVALGQLAVQKGTSDDVKKFGQRMVDDHGKANQQLQQIAASSGVQLPQQPEAGFENVKQMLSGLSGQAFDRFYMEIMLKDHHDDVAAFTRENLTGQNTAIKSFASSTLPVLQDHLNSVGTIMNAQNNNAPNNSSAQTTPMP